ncbi:Integrator complex subunit 12 [Chamberlinius hualienensis]
MATQAELDPLFVEALRLLHSKAPDSCEQLKRLLDDVLHQVTPTSVIHGYSGAGKAEKEIVLSAKIQASASYKKGSPKHFHSSGDGVLSLPSPKSSSPGPQPTAITTKSSSKIDVGQKSGLGSEKRTHDKISGKSDSYSESKKLKIDVSSSSSSSKPSSSISKVKIEPDVELSSSQEENTSATDLAVEMGLACVVCRSIQFSSGNTLVECQDCHNLYHQECHRPPITDQDVNDPRLVWYCARCTKTMKKMVNKNNKNVKPITASSSKDSNSGSKSVKQEPVVNPPTTSVPLFKRIEPKLITSTASSASSGNKPIGLAGLAASLSGKTLPSQKTSQAAPSSKPSVSFSGSKTSSNSSDNGKTTPTPASSKPNPFPSLFANAKPAATYGGGNGNNGGNNRENATSTAGKFASGGGSNATTSISSSKVSSSSSASGNSSGNNGSSSSGASGSSSSSSKSTSSSSLMSADKRLQIMKKKAAAKMQEKRRSTNK